MRPFRLLAAAVAAVVLSHAPAASAQAPAPTPREVRKVEGVTEYALPNGLQLLLVPDASKPTTTVNLVYRVGSRHESYGETGMAHLLEHLLFKGTPTTRLAWGEFSRRGLRANGTTWLDRTNYFASFAADDANLQWYLGWLADSMVNSFIARGDLDTEMTVVRNEMESGENNPVRVLIQNTLATMYTWHNYGKSTIGARSDVENVDIPRLQAFYRKYYQPDNATLVVTGRFDTQKVLAWVADGLGRLPKPARVLEPSYTLEPVQDGERTVTVRRVGGAPVLMAGYHVMPSSSPDYGAVELLAQILGDPGSGRLHKALVDTGLAARVYTIAWSFAEPGPLLAAAELAPGQDVDKARAALVATLDAAATQPVAADEFERAKRQWLNAWDKGYEDPEKIGTEMTEAIAAGDWRLYFLARDHVRRTTAADVERVARAYLKRDNRTLASYLPTPAPERAPAPTRVDVAKLVEGYQGDPGVREAEAFDPTPANLDARTQRSALASGLQVALLPKGTRGQSVRARLRLRVGDAESLRGQGAAMQMAAALYDKGGAGMTRQQIADAFDRLQADVGFVAQGQAIDVVVATRREHLPAVIALVGRLVREPAFPEPALEEVRRQALSGIERDRREPGALIRKRVLQVGNPYPRGDLRHEPSYEELEADVRAVTRAQVAAFQRRFVSAQAGSFAAVGDLDAAAVQAALRASFGDWARPDGGPLPYVRAPRPLVAVPAANLIERVPDKQNANLYGRLAVPLDDRDPDYPALLMANQLFGVPTGSRLWKRIRETEGLSYDVRTGVDANPFEPNSSLLWSAIFAPQNRGRVEQALRDEIAKSLQEGYTQAELDGARAGVLNARRLARAQDAVVASQLVANLELDRSFAEAQRVDDALQRLTLAQVNAAWRRLVKPENLVLGWGGSFAAP